MTLERRCKRNLKMGLRITTKTSLKRLVSKSLTRAECKRNSQRPECDGDSADEFEEYFEDGLTGSISAEFEEACKGEFGERGLAGTCRQRSLNMSVKLRLKLR